MPTAAPIQRTFSADGLADALQRIASTAADRDAAPAFPEEPIAWLERAGVLALGAAPGPRRPDAAFELGVLRRTAAADASVGRILDGHLNAVERLAVQAPAAVRDRELALVSAGRLRAGVWGGDPRPGEGPPAAVLERGGAPVLRGVKTFCSGAGGLDRALVLARQPADPAPVAVWVDLTGPERVEIDRGWYRGAGLRASESHRVVFHEVPILASFGGPGALTEQPWISRDALRTAATWAGMVDAALHAALGELAERAGRGALEDLAAGRMLAAAHAVDAWLAAAGRAMDSGIDLPRVSLDARVGIRDAAEQLLRTAAHACGSWPFAHGGRLDRARRDLELFTLQHRLDPMLARRGAAALEARS